MQRRIKGSDIVNLAIVITLSGALGLALAVVPHWANRGYSGVTRADEKPPVKVAPAEPAIALNADEVSAIKAAQEPIAKAQADLRTAFNALSKPEAATECDRAISAVAQWQLAQSRADNATANLRNILTADVGRAKRDVDKVWVLSQDGKSLSVQVAQQ